jgi:hypothetical protein
MEDTGLLERYYIHRSALGLYNSVGVTASYAIPSSLFPSPSGGDFSVIKNLVFHVLTDIIPLHPPLSITLGDIDTKTPHYKYLETIDLTDVVTFTQDQPPETQIASTHSQPLRGADGSLPLWRVSVNTLHTSGSTDTVRLDVGFFFNHCLGDGFSGAAFHHSFLSALNKSLPSEAAVVASPCSAVVCPPRQALLPDFETAVSLPITVSGLLRLGYDAIFPEKGIWAGASIQCSGTQGVVTRLAVLRLGKERVDDLVALCRQEKTSVTALLTYVIAIVLAHELEEEHIQGLTAVIAVSMRRFAPAVTPRDMVAYTSGIDCTFRHDARPGKGKLPSCAGEPFDWDEARRVKEELDAKTSSNKNHLSAFLRLVPDLKAYLLAKVGKPRRGSFEVSNLGVVDMGDATGGVKCEGLLFSQAANVTGMPYVFSLATLKGGGMSIVLSWQDGILEEEAVGRVMEELDAWLRVERLR